LVFRLAVFEGLRPGEILALRLGNVFDDHVAVDQRVDKGTLDTPKGRKGRRTARKVALSPGTAMEIAVWRTMLLKTTPDAYVFPTEPEHPAEPRQSLESAHAAETGDDRTGVGHIPGPAPD